ncbi:hypothetical protein PCK1_000077 [Pneumocystis canis]|nr:hypothetical protein PCK1_000077 [Pneumocystis canis]
MLDGGNFQQNIHVDVNHVPDSTEEKNMEHGFIPFEAFIETVSEVHSETLSEVPFEFLSEPSSTSSDVLLNKPPETLLELPLVHGENVETGLNFHHAGTSVNKALSVSQEEFVEPSVMTDTFGQSLPEKVIENQTSNTADSSIHCHLPNMDQDRLYKEDTQLSTDNPQECSKERDPERLDINTSLCSETIQETINQDHHLLSNIPNPIPSSLDLQKLLAGLSPVLQVDSQSATLQTTLNKPFSPNSTKAMNSTSSTTDTTATQPALAQQHRHQDSADHDPSSIIHEDALFQKFLTDEKHIMSNTAPHEFPPGSRIRPYTNILLNEKKDYFQKIENSTSVLNEKYPYLLGKTKREFNLSYALKIGAGEVKPNERMKMNE